MSKRRLPLIALLVLQAVAVLIYPPAFLRQAPQAAVLPPVLLILFGLALAAMNSGGLTPIAGRSSLVFVQGINIVVRMMMFMPNLKGPEGQWNWLFLIFQVIGIALSWYTITEMENRRLRSLLLKSAT